MQFDIDVKSDNKRIISSGIIFLIDDKDCSFEIKNSEDENDTLKFRFVFEVTSDKERKFLTNIENNELIFKCINFNNGTSTKKILNIGYFEENEKKIMIFINFSYYKGLDDSPAKFYYTIYAEEE